jgi:hypothetical protein
VWLFIKTKTPTIKKHKDLKNPCVEKKIKLQSNSFKEIIRYIKEQLDMVEKANSFFKSDCFEEIKENTTEVIELIKNKYL